MFPEEPRANREKVTEIVRLFRGLGGLRELIYFSLSELCNELHLGLLRVYVTTSHEAQVEPTQGVPVIPHCTTRYTACFMGVVINESDKADYLEYKI
jgi:hypothetical protein